MDSGDLGQPCSLPAGTGPSLVFEGGWEGDRGPLKMVRRDLGTCHPGRTASPGHYTCPVGEDLSHLPCQAPPGHGCACPPSPQITLTFWPCQRWTKGQLGWGRGD